MIAREMPTRDARSLSHEASAELRRSAVRMVLGGKSQLSVARALDVHHVTVCKWMKSYEERGDELFLAKEAPGAETKLTESEIKKLRKIIVGKNPDQLNFGVKLWTLPIIGQLIESKFRKVLHQTTIARLLNRIGVTPQKPVKQSYKRDDEEVRQWTSERFPEIVRLAKKKQATLLFADETGIHEDHAVGTTWAERGKTPVIKVTGTRRRINVISAVSPRGRLWFRCYHGTLTAARYSEFLRDLLRDVRGKIVLIHDRHPTHHSVAARRFIKAQARRLTVFELPSYAPDLNPDEHVWSMLKGMYRRDPVHADENFGEGVEAAMAQIASDRQLVQKFFGHPSVQYIKDALKW